MSGTPALDDLFEHRMTYPDVYAQERLARLVGLDDHKARLTKILGLLVNPAGLEAWLQRHHPGANGVLNSVLRRPPLVVLAGDVGAGKSELAETIGDAVARQERIDVTLFPMSLSTRGQGRVGEMTQLLSAAFDHTIAEAKKLKGSSAKARGAVLLLVDEADALAQSREASQMHHEDRAGVNAFIRGIDRIGNGRLPAAVIMSTNRLGALDPAVKRRAAGSARFLSAADRRRGGSDGGEPWEGLRFHVFRSEPASAAVHRARCLPGECGKPGQGARTCAGNGTHTALQGDAA
jgi:hypothetical protein